MFCFSERLLFQKREKAFFLIGCTLDALDLVAGGVDGIAQFLLVQLLLRLDDGLPLRVGRSDLLRLREGLAHRLVDMALAHAAHHTVYLYHCFDHCLFPP